MAKHDADGLWAFLAGRGIVADPAHQARTYAGHAVPLGWGWGLRKAEPAEVLDAIAASNRRGDPAVITVHPWEIDPRPPHVRLPAPLAFAHYFKLSGFRTRLRAVLRGAEFGPLSDLPVVQAWRRA